MDLLSPIALLVIIVIVALAIVAFPTQVAASAVGAKNTGCFSSLLAMFVAGILHSIGLSVPCFGSIVAFLLSSLGFSWILGTSFWRGMIVQVLSVIISAIIIVILTAIFGINILEYIPNF